MNFNTNVVNELEYDGNGKWTIYNHTDNLPGEFLLVCYPSGSKYWYVRWKNEQDSTKAKSLGLVGEVSFNEAYEAAKEYRVEREAKQYLYIARSPYHPELVKIGLTTKHPVARVRELHGQLIEEFELLYYSVINDGESLSDAESELHQRVADHRVTNNREFFHKDCLVDVLYDREWVKHNTPERETEEARVAPEAANAKQCHQCGEIKWVSEFTINRAHRDGLCRECKTCTKANRDARNNQ